MSQIQNQLQKDIIEEGKLNQASPQPGNKNPEILEVLLDKKDQKGQVLEKIKQTIKIIRKQFKKPMLGAYQNTLTGHMYYLAFAQTHQIKTEHPSQITRLTQTYQYTTRSTKVYRQQGTQMERPGIYITQHLDKTISSKAYFDSDMWQDLRIQASLFIQRMVRGWFARKRTNGLKKQKEELRLMKLKEEQQFCKLEEQRHKKQIQRRRHPRTKEDFKILYQELQMWRQKEVKKIKQNKNLTQQQRKVALKEALDKETDLLQTIDRLKIIANKQNKQQKIQKFLKSMSDPKKWKRSDNRFTQVHTPFTIRAKQLMDIYKGLKMKNLSIDQRLDVLLNTKWTVKEHQSNLTRDIVQLIDRQANLLDRGRPQPSLQGLRQRLANLFLMFIEYPGFNPQAVRFQKIPYEIIVKSNQSKNVK